MVQLKTINNIRLPVFLMYADCWCITPLPPLAFIDLHTWVHGFQPAKLSGPGESKTLAGWLIWLRKAKTHTQAMDVESVFILLDITYCLVPKSLLCCTTCYNT